MSGGNGASALGGYFEVSGCCALTTPEQPGRGLQRREALPTFPQQAVCGSRSKENAHPATHGGRERQAVPGLQAKQKHRVTKTKEPTLKSHGGLWLLSGCYTDIVACWALDLGYQASPMYKVKWDFMFSIIT